MSDITRTIHLDGGEQALQLRKYRLIPDGGEPIELEAARIFLGTSPENDVSFNDSTVSRVHGKIEVDEAGYRYRDLGSKNGSAINGLRVHDAYLEPGCELRLGKLALRFEVSPESVEVRYSSRSAFGGLLGQSLAMREIFSLLERVAPTPATVLIEGESGTGKELIAEAIHSHSPRKDKPFVVFDCSAVSRELIESELFGHVKGAFTGAVGNRKGAFEQAHGGTLFLDELGELDLDLQPKLLRVLEKREIRPVGAATTTPIDVRIVAATNRNLLHEVEAGNFREDLFYRFAVIKVHVPPLRKRTEDIPLLAENFLAQTAERLGRSELQIPYRTMEKLKRYPWPGNVRELRNYVERAGLLAQDDKLETRFLNLGEPSANALSEDDTASATSIADMAIDAELPFKDAKSRLIESFETSYWSRLLERTDGNVSKAARIAGVHRKSVEYILKKLDLRREDILGD